MLGAVPHPGRWLLPALIALSLSALPSGAESLFRLAYPKQFGPIPAATYDDAGHRIGGANLFIERLPSGNVRIHSESGQNDGARTLAVAELEPVVPGRTLRLVSQESRSLNEGGREMGVLSVDHVAGLAHCRDSTGATLSEVRLPDRDRVVNVPLNLFFLPLVRGETASLEFQLFLCRPDARLMDFEAWIERGEPEHGRAIEIRYAPNMGLATPLARQLAPKLSVWFDPTAPYFWQGHRLPLYSGGPEVLVVRDDISEASLVTP